MSAGADAAGPAALRDGSERWGVVRLVLRRVVRWWFGLRRPHAGWSGGAGDARRTGDVQGSVGLHPESPTPGEGLQPVMGTAEAAQIHARRLAALGVRQHVVVVGPADPLSAVGHPASAVSGVDEPLLGGRWLIGIGRRRHARHGAVAAAGD